MPTDEELMLAVKDGDMTAFAQIVRRHQGMAWSVAYRFTGNRTDAEDIAQEAFLRLLGAAERYRPISSFRTFFSRIITHLCLDFAGKKRGKTADLAEFPATGPSGDATASASDRAAAVLRALAVLPANQRAAMVLRYYEDLGYREIADTLGITEKAVERLLARARAALEPLLEGWLDN
jgi:RNA polymerase sigma-70 factor (ECF subfamily)